MASRVASLRPLLSGWVAVYKPRGVFSMDCVGDVMKATGASKAGHCGTLDAPAEGVLPIALGGATRFIQYLPDTKVYETSIQFGTSTTSDDVTGSVLHQAPVPWLQEHHVTALLERFIGRVKQRPPQLSAVHVQGQRLHKLPLDFIPEKEVVINSITPTAFRGGQFPEIDLTVECRAGTYVRSIARDLGLLIAGPPPSGSGDGLPTLSSRTVAGPDAGIGAVTRIIRRTHSSGFGVEHCATMQSVSPGSVLPVDAAFSHLASVQVHRPGCSECQHGAGMHDPDGRPCACVRRQLELWQSGAHIHMPGTAPLDLARVYATSPLESVLPSSVADVDSRVKAPASAARDGPPTTTSRHFIGLGELAPRHPAQLPAHDPATPASSSAGHGGYGSLDDATFLKRVRGAPLPYEPVNHRRKKPRRNRDKNRQQWATAR